MHLLEAHPDRQPAKTFARAYALSGAFLQAKDEHQAQLRAAMANPRDALFHIGDPHVYLNNTGELVLSHIAPTPTPSPTPTPTPGG